jgi:hypothetical protein
MANRYQRTLAPCLAHHREATLEPNANYNATHQAQSDVGQVSVQKTVDRVLEVAVHEIGIAATHDTKI